MIMRLEMVEKGLVEKLKLASEEQRKGAVKVACGLAFLGKGDRFIFDLEKKGTDLFSAVAAE